MFTTTARPSRVRFATGKTAERLQQRRDAVALARYREQQQLQRDLLQIEALTAADQSAGVIATILGLFA